MKKKIIIGLLAAIMAVSATACSTSGSSSSQSSQKTGTVEATVKATEEETTEEPTGSESSAIKPGIMLNTIILNSRSSMPKHMMKLSRVIITAIKLVTEKNFLYFSLKFKMFQRKTNTSICSISRLMLMTTMLI